MERARLIKLKAGAVLSALMALELSAFAGTIVLDPPTPKDLNWRDTDEEYAESRFGDHSSEGLEVSVARQDRGSRGRWLASDSIQSRAASPESTTTVDAILPMKGRGVQEVALIASDLGYFPKTVFVNRDTPVRMYVTGASKNSLCIMMDAFQVRKQVRSQKIEEITFTPSTPGKYRFYCPVNGMEGTMIVRELVSS